MIPRYRYLFFGLFLIQHLHAQSYFAVSKIGAQFGLYASDQHRQSVNPAAFAPHYPQEFAIQITFPVFIPNVMSLQMQAQYPWQKSYIFHEINGVFHPAHTQLRFTNAVALPLSPQLNIGLAIQGQLYMQPHIYGNLFQMSTKLGLTYQLHAQHYLSLVLDDIAPKQIQTVRLEHWWRLNHQVQFAQGLSWNPTQRPEVYLSLIQQFSAYRLHFAISLPTSQFQFGFTHPLRAKWHYQLTQSWQSSLGYLFQLTFYHR